MPVQKCLETYWMHHVYALKYIYIYSYIYIYIYIVHLNGDSNSVMPS